MLVKNYDLDIPKINVLDKQIVISLEGSINKQELLFTGTKNANGELLLHLNKKSGYDSVVASMSYKKIGQKLSKKISVTGGLDFFFKYNKTKGYFNKERSLISPSGNEYSIYDMTMKKFYSELIDVLKLRFALGYIESEDKTKSVNSYFRDAHKYILMNKYNLGLDECMNFLRGVVSKSYIPEKFFNGFLLELDKSIYDGELSNDKKKEVENMAVQSLKNEKRGKVAFDDVSLHKNVLEEIRKIENDRQFNMIKLQETINTNSYQ